MIAPKSQDVVAVILAPILPLVAVANSAGEILGKRPVCRPAWPTNVAGTFAGSTGSTDVAGTIAGPTRPTDIAG
jgi:hypothetical protein